jgi:hypothetical protein
LPRSAAKYNNEKQFKSIKIKNNTITTLIIIVAPTKKYTIATTAVNINNSRNNGHRHRLHNNNKNYENNINRYEGKILSVKISQEMECKPEEKL